VPEDVLAGLHRLGLSSWCNVVAAIQVARRLDLGAGEALLTVATDGAEMYGSELERILDRDFGGALDARAAETVHRRYLLEPDVEHLLELGPRDRERIFNLGYFTWVEQQGLSMEDLVARRDQEFWRALHPLVATWDERIGDLNRRTGADR
jgi:hypothetical protein